MTDLPDGWKSVAVADLVTDIKSGFASGKHNSTGSGVAHLRPMNVSRLGRIDLSAIKFVDDESDRRLRRGDVLFNNTNSPDLVGKTALVVSDEELAFSNHMTRLRADTSRVLASFLAAQLHANWHSGFFKSICSNHVNQASVSGKRLATVPLAVPSLEEQAEIVQILDTQLARLDTVLEAVQAVRDRADQLRRSLLHAAFTGQLTQPDPTRDVSDLPAGWNSVAVADLVTDIKSGFASGKHNTTGSGVAHLRPMNVSRLGRIDLSAIKFVDDKSDRRLRRGDVLFNNTNSPDLVGKTALVVSDEELAFSNHMTRLRADTSRVLASFLAAQLHANWHSGFFKSICSNHVNQASVSGKRLATVPLAVPSLEEQAEVVQVLDTQLARLDSALSAADEVGAECGRLRRSLLQTAFTGELTKTWREANG